MARLQEDIRRLRFWRSLLAEFLGTLFLVLIGCGSWADTDKQSHLFVLKVSLAFGLTLAAVLYCMRGLGEPHLNPAVSVAMLITKRTSVVKWFLFVICQLVGAILGAALVKAITVGGVHNGSACTVPQAHVNEGQAFGVEFFASFFYVFVVFACLDTARRGSEAIAPFINGLTYSAVLMFAIPYTGGSANTARSFGPALVNNIWKSHWVYWFGPLFGGIAGGGIYELIFSTKASFRRLHACLFVFHRGDAGGQGEEATEGQAGGRKRKGLKDDVERGAIDSNAEEGEEEDGTEIRKDAPVSTSADDEIIREGRETAPGGPRTSRRPLRDIRRPKLPKKLQNIHVQRPKFTCCESPPDEDVASSPSPPLQQTHYQQQQQQAPTTAAAQLTVLPAHTEIQSPGYSKETQTDDEGEAVPPPY